MARYSSGKMVFATAAFGLIFGCDKQPEMLPMTDEMKVDSACAKVDRRRPHSRQIDYGERLHEFGRSAFWRTVWTYLGDTCFVARIGPVYYEDELNNVPDYYAIEADRQHGESAIVYFSRQLRIDTVPDEILNRVHGSHRVRPIRYQCQSLTQNEP